MGDRWTGYTFSGSDDRNYYRDRFFSYSQESDFDSSSRFDRSRYGSGVSRPSSAKASQEYSSRRDFSSDGLGGSSAPRSSSPGKTTPTTRQPYHDSFFEDMRLEDEEPPTRSVPRREERPQPVHNYSRYSASNAYGSHPQRDFSDSFARDDEQRTSLPSRKRKPRKKLFIALGVILALVLVGAGAAFAYVSNISGNLHRGIDQDLRNALVHTDMANEPFYMLLLGTDGSAQRDTEEEFGGVYRSDSMMLVRIDPVNNKATLISIGRDIMVDLPGYGEQKINAAYGLGGPALAVKAVSQLAGVDISHYAQVDFDGFSSLVDALGGVEVDVPVDIDDSDAGGSLNAGVQILDGNGALILCRSRNTYIDSAHPDEMRAANQRLVMSAIAKKLLDSDVAAIASSVQAMSEFVTTDLELTDIIGLAQAMQGLNPETDIYTAMAPTTSQYVDDIWWEYIDQTAWTAMMDRVKKGLPPTEEAYIDDVTGTVLATAGGGAKVSSGARYASITVKNGTERSGLAAAARTKLIDAGFTDVIIGDVAEGFDYPDTLVIYDDEVSKYGAEQIVEILGQGEVFFNDGSYLLSDTDYLLVIGEDWND